MKNSFKCSIFKLLLISIVLALGAGAVSAKTQIRFQGEARDLDSGELLYREFYWLELGSDGQALTGKVEYRLPDDTVFASKELDYRGNPIAPSMQFSDSRANTNVRVLSTPGEVALVASANASTNTNASTSANTNANTNESAQTKEKKTRLSLSSGQLVVVDAGFDQLVQLYWSSLLAGDALDFSFLVLSRASLIDFQIKLAEQTAQQAFFEIKPRSRLISWFMEPIRLGYDLQTRRLLSFEGVTNIEKPGGGGDNHTASIHYQYVP